MTELVASTDMQVFEIPVNDIYCDADFNCRGAIAPIDVIELARSITDNGLQQPITIQPMPVVVNGKKYRIVSGHRRYTAFIVNGAKTIPCIIKPGLTELQARILNLEENLKRKDLNILQEANAIAHFLRAKWTQEEVAQQLGQSRGWVQARFNLLNLPVEIQQEAAAGFLTQEHIKQLSGMKSNQERFEAVKKIKDAKLRGDKKKIKITAPAKLNPLVKKVRDREQIFVMQGEIQEIVGNSFATRCLAWAAGEISDFELYRDLREFALEHGVIWEIPAEILARMKM